MAAPAGEGVMTERVVGADGLEVGVLLEDSALRLLGGEGALEVKAGLWHYNKEKECIF